MMSSPLVFFLKSWVPPNSLVFGKGSNHTSSYEFLALLIQKPEGQGITYILSNIAILSCPFFTSRPTVFMVKVENFVPKSML